jgi:hypothetical protein
MCCLCLLHAFVPPSSFVMISKESEETHAFHKHFTTHGTMPEASKTEIGRKA